MTQLKPIAETLEATNNKVIAHCFNTCELVEIGSIVTIKQLHFSWLAIITSISTGSRFQGGIQPLGLLSNDLQNQYPELSFIETKKMELELITSTENGFAKKPLAPPSPHSVVYEIATESLAPYFKCTMIIQSIAASIAEGLSSEILMSGFLNQLNKTNNHTFTQEVVEQILISIYQSSEGKTELIKKLCQTIENANKKIQILL